MKLYRVPNAPAGQRWQRTKDEAQSLARHLDPNLVTKGAGGWVSVEVPTDQRGLVAWLNERTASAVARGATLVTPPAEQPAKPSPTTIGDCPKCRMAPKAAERLAGQMTAAAIAERVMELDGYDLGVLASAVIERMKELAR